MAEMYAFARHFAIRGPTAVAARLIGAAGACAALSACVGNPFGDAQVDPNSPVADEVAKVERLNRDYPRFSDIPSKPKDVRPPAQYARQADELERAREDLLAQTAPETWSLTGSDAFAGQARKAAGSEPAPSPSGETAGFADTQRRRATSPSPPSPN
jgi:hypothetical protein